MKTLVLAIILAFSALSVWSAPTIQQEVYYYKFDGKRIDPNPCELYTRTYLIKNGLKPGSSPSRSDFVQYEWGEDCSQFNGLLKETRIVWYTPSMIDSYVLTLQNRVQTGVNAHAGPLVDSQPKMLREMANYANVTYTYGTPGGEFSRIAEGRTRFWMTGAANQFYHVKVKITGGWWSNWFPGDLYPGDVESVTFPPPVSFTFVTLPSIKIGGITPNSAGEVTMYWNPYANEKVDLTPTFSDPVKNRHWIYALEMTIIP